MGLNYFMIEGRASTDFGAVIESAGVYGAPSRVYEEVSVPGRNGTLLFDEGRYENIDVSYDVAIRNDGVNLDGFRAWIQSFSSYVRIEDTYHPEEYRLGIPKGGLSPKMSQGNKNGRLTVTFNCKPQRFLKIGEIGTPYATDVTLFNPTHYDAQPLIRVYGYGDLGIGDETVTITSHSLSYIDLDCALQDAFCGSTNANQYVTLSGTEYPVLKPGSNGITLDNNISSVIIYPRWWTL